jgi:hypothetical protein
MINFVGKIGLVVFKKFTTMHRVIETEKIRVVLRDDRSFVFVITTSYEPTLSDNPAITVSRF